MKSYMILSSLLILISGVKSYNETGGKFDKSMKNIHKEGFKRFQVVSINFEKVAVPFEIGLWLLFATLVKIAFHQSEKFTGFVPFSAMEIILGLILGGILYIAQYMGSHAFLSIQLSPFLFFMFLLPQIVFEAGYSMPLRAFAGNIGTILVYAVVGTLWNVVAIGLSLYGLSRFGCFTTPTSLLDLLLFASIISAVDPVAVLTVFEEVHVNEVLYICVFGESLLNDAVTVVLYHIFESFEHLNQDEGIMPIDVVAGGVSFFLVALGGTLIGLVWAILTAFTTKFTNHLRVVQPLICLLYPYLAYLSAETIHVSGILAIVFCAMVMKQYVRDNITRSSTITVKYFLKTLSSISETIIFIFLGISAVAQWGKNALSFDPIFILATLAFSLIYRFFGVFLLTAIMNHFRVVKISFVDQFIMAYGGLRGAVAYGLVASLVKSNVLNSATGNVYLTTTIIVTLFTVFVLGTTIKPLVKLLRVKREDMHEISMSERIMFNAADHAMAGIEVISGQRGANFLKDILHYIHGHVLYPCLVQEQRRISPENLLSKFRQINEQEAKNYMKKHGSLNVLNPQLSRSNTTEYLGGLTNNCGLVNARKRSQDLAKLRWKMAYRKVRSNLVTETMVIKALGQSSPTAKRADNFFFQPKTPVRSRQFSYNRHRLDPLSHFEDEAPARIIAPRARSRLTHEAKSPRPEKIASRPLYLGLAPQEYERPQVTFLPNIATVITISPREEMGLQQRPPSSSGSHSGSGFF